MHDVRHVPQLQHTQEHSLAGGERKLTPSTHVRERVEMTASVVKAAWSHTPEAALVLDSRLEAGAGEFETEAVIDYAELPGFPLSTVDSVPGRMLCGRLGGRSVVALAGRFQVSEGYSLQQVTFPVRVVRALGARNLMVTGSCEALDPDWAVGHLALVVDHINLLGDNPLVGPNDDSLGPRFPDMTAAYSPELAEVARAVAATQGVSLRDAVYAAVTGPSRSTEAECRMLQRVGANVVGLSMVPETIVGVHGGMRVLGVVTVDSVRTAGLGESQSPEVRVRAQSELVALLAGAMERL